MLTLPAEYITILKAFASLFSKRVWLQAQVLLLGAILAPGQRTVTAVLRIMGLSAEKHFQNYHRVLNRAVWSSREAYKPLPTFSDALALVRQEVWQHRYFQL